MFERNRVDNAHQTTPVAVEITLQDGIVRKGRFHISASRTLVDVLNGEQRFIDFESHDGDRMLLAKSSVTAVKVVSVPNVAQLKTRLRDTEAFCPHATLGLAASAPWDEVRRAYVALSKTYHPDRFSGVELPNEVRDYLSAMARRINTAYTSLEAPVLAAKRAEAARAEPIYTSSRRA